MYSLFLEYIITKYNYYISKFNVFNFVLLNILIFQMILLFHLLLVFYIIFIKIIMYCMHFIHTFSFLESVEAQLRKLHTAAGAPILKPITHALTGRLLLLLRHHLPLDTHVAEPRPLCLPLCR